MIKLPVFIVMWLLFICIKLPTWILGLFITPLLWLYRKTPYPALPFWTRPWSNPEDWFGRPHHFTNSLPRWWVDAHGLGFWSFYRYHSWRNGANGLRSFEFLDLTIVPTKIGFVSNAPMVLEPWVLRETNQKTGAYLAWQGIKAGMKILILWPDLKKDITFFKLVLIEAGPKHFVMKLGWRVEPRFRNDDVPDLHLEDAGFASKLIPYRNG